MQWDQNKQAESFPQGLLFFHFRKLWPIALKKYNSHAVQFFQYNSHKFQHCWSLENPNTAQ